MPMVGSHDPTSLSLMMLSVCVSLATRNTCMLCCKCRAQAIEAMLQSFCEDCERNDGSAMHPYYMPPAFKKIILEAADRQKTGSRLTGAIMQIGQAVKHVVQKAIEPVGGYLRRLVTNWSDRPRPGGYRSVKQQLPQK